jgi:Flp pilus assembly protein TadG
MAARVVSPATAARLREERGGKGDSLRGERGQVLVFSVVLFAVLLGMAALAVDLGSWYRTQRQDQVVADAAALAGAQALPDDPAQAANLASAYAQKNGATLAAGAVTIKSTSLPNDTIQVSYPKSSPAFFAKIFGIDHADTREQATARSGVPGAARFVAPIVVPATNPMLQCSPPPCAGLTQISLLDLHKPGGGNAAGSFALLNLEQNGSGTADAGTLAEWMADGYPDEMPIGTYFGAASTNYNSSAFQDALTARVGTEVLFPVYQAPILNGGSNGEFNIVGWVGFHINSQTAGGSSGTLVGYFTRFIAQGLPAAGNQPGSNDYGVRVVWLSE